MQEETKRLYIAIIVALFSMFFINMLFPSKKVQPETPAPELKTEAPVQNLKQEKISDENLAELPKNIEDILPQDARININNDVLSGSIRLKGARFDNLTLKKYTVTLEPDSGDVQLFQPAKSETPYYAEMGWLSTNSDIKTPDANTLWHSNQKELKPGVPLILEWDNGQGLRFIRRISLDNNYMFNIQQDVINNSGKDIALYPYALINRKVAVTDLPSSVVHEGLIGVVNNTLKEIKFKDLKGNKSESFKSDAAWAGFSDRYWFSAFILDNDGKHTVKFAQTGEKTFQTDFIGDAVNVPAGAAASNNFKIYAGAKEIKLLDQYKKNYNINKFDLAVDFGWYYFLTKPFFYILDALYHFIGNMGWAILLFAALLRLVMFPVANKSFESMSKMKKIQPKLQELQVRYNNDKVAQQKAVMEMYKREKINPAAGCLPMLIQIPVFFSLYKVLNIAIEIRHAPFIGWIKDLSAPDPLTISQIIHLPVPGLINIGVWPIIMGLTMFIQQKLNPAPTNKDQARAFALMPLIFMFMLGHFASGLVIYWTLSNVLSIIQQKAIMAKNGVK